MRLTFLALMAVLVTAGAGCAWVPSAPDGADAVACPPIFNGCFAD